MNNKKIYNCPNCGAPIGYGSKCEYCGTPLDWMPIDLSPVKIVLHQPRVKTYVSRISIPIRWMNDIPKEEREKIIKNRLVESMFPAVEENMELDGVDIKEWMINPDMPDELLITGRVRLVSM